MKRIIRRILLLMLVFLLALGGFAAYQYYTGIETDSYEAMGAATLPIVRLNYLEDCSNELHGYTQKMQVSSMRGCITPVPQDHKLKITIEESDGVAQVRYEVRGLNGSRLVEDGEITGWETEGSTMSAQLQLSSLIDDEAEYQLILCLEQKERNVWYYSRVIYLEDGHTESLVGFARDFMEASSQGNADFVVNYIQPNDTMGTNDFGYVNQHSRSGMITWKGVGLEVTGSVQTTLTELSDSQASITLSYPVTLTSGETTRSCSVTEQYVVRFRNDVLYLLDFERHTKEVFSCTEPLFDGAALELGITSEEPVRMESPNGKIQVYVYDGNLLACSSKENTMRLVYTYKDGNDRRSSWDHYQLQPIRVDDSGDIYFMAYGYHNRGNHEGQAGVSFLHYVAEGGFIDEIFYIPVTFSEEILLQDMGTLAYVNNETDLMYLLYGGRVYSIDLSSGEKVELAASSGAGGFFGSQDSSLIGWEEGSQKEYPDTIRVVNLSNGSSSRIEAGEGEFLQIQGFLNNDLVYGVGRISDVCTQAGQITAKPMYVLKIAAFGDDTSTDGPVQVGEYAAEGMYIEGTQILENQVEIYRMVRSGNGYKAAENDQMFLNNRSGKTDGTILKTRILDGFLRIAQLRLEIDTEKTVIETQMGQIRDTESAYRLNLNSDNISSNYYVYTRGRLAMITPTLSEAIDRAYDEMGVVTDGNASCIWTRGTRALSKSLYVEQWTAAEYGNSLKAGLAILISCEGGNPEVIDTLSEEGKSPAEIITASMEKVSGQNEGSVQNLKGCTTAQVLYYLNADHPVLAVTGDQSAVLLVGYDTQNVLIYDPEEGEVRTLTHAEADVFFAPYENTYLCWLDQE